MTKSPIEAQWLEIEREHFGGICDDLCELQRAAFFAGAMAAMQTIAAWSPRWPRKFAINAGQLSAVADELALTFNVIEAADEAATTPDLVRH